MSDASGNPHVKDVSWKAVAVSIGKSLEVYPKDEDNKEALWFVGTYTGGTKDTSVGEYGKERKANGNLENGDTRHNFTAFADHSSATFTVKKTKKGNAYAVTISFFDSKKVDEVVYSYAASFKGEGDIREGKGEGTWSGIPGNSDDQKKVLQKAAVAESQKNELTVSESVVVDGTSSANHGQNTNKEILTFVGQYSGSEEAFTDRESWEEKRKASGHLAFLEGTEFAAKGKTKFKATRKQGPEDIYEVTISFGTLGVDGNQQSVFAEFKGEGDIREGEGEGTWETKKIQLNYKELQQISPI